MKVFIVNFSNRGNIITSWRSYGKFFLGEIQMLIDVREESCYDSGDIQIDLRLETSDMRLELCLKSQVSSLMSSLNMQS